MILLKKKYHIIFVLLILGLYACEKDDVCLEPTTPNLVVSFYDINTPETKKAVSDLTLIALPGLDTIYKNVSKDSISIALNVNADTARFKLISNTNTDIVQFEYTREDIFVSKTCGYKTVFHNLQVIVETDADNWIKNHEIINHEITSDNLAHVKILH